MVDLTSLPFDSALFGYPVGKCILRNDWNEALFLEQAGDYQLVYIFSDTAIDVLSQSISLADVRLTFEKKLNSFLEKEAAIQPYTGTATDKLMALTLESGTFSRFKTDPGFVREEYEKLYRLWISNALGRKEVLVAEDLAGFVTCHTSEKESNIGLIAVDPNKRGVGWGKRLVRAAENFAYERGALTLRIGTQEANAPAVALYQSLDYHVTERCFIYHYWSPPR
jgi:dTDP-4-amino-4,6-dideoxy-D-galactose acyltransferase